MPDTGRHSSLVALLRQFRHEHLPEPVADVGREFHDMAHWLAERLPDSVELTTLVKRLLDASELGVRAAFNAEDGKREKAPGA